MKKDGSGRLDKYEMDYSRKFDNMADTDSGEEDGEEYDYDKIEGVSQVELLPGAPKVNQVHIDPNQNQDVQMSKIMQKINESDSKKKAKEYRDEMALEDQVIWTFEVAGCGSSKCNGIFRQINNGKYHNGAPRYRNADQVFLTRELQEVSGSGGDRQYGWIFGTEGEALYGAPTDKLRYETLTAPLVLMLTY